jgi:hypothetical protein
MVDRVVKALRLNLVPVSRVRTHTEFRKKTPKNAMFREFFG